MCDRYPAGNRYGRPQYERGERGEHNDSYYYDRYEDYDRYGRSPPPARYPSDRYDHRDDHYIRNDEFAFRGAAERDNYRPRQPQENFSFRTQGSTAPRFPSPDPHAPPPPQARARRTENTRREQGKRGPAGQYSDRTLNGQAPRRFRKRPPHERDLLQRARRASTPDQLLGMNADGQARFKAVDSSSDEENVIDLTNGSDDDIEADAPRKRVKAEESQPTELAAPKWSNPEYLTALPPPETLGAPKKDIVQVIRKAKVDSAPKTDSSANAVKDNVDFISFNFGEEGEIMSEDDPVSENRPPSNAPVGPSGFGGRSAVQPNGAGVANGRGRQPDPPPSTFQPINLRSSNKMDDDVGPPPLPPPELSMPTDEELIAYNGGNTKGMKRKRGEQSKDIGDVVPDWRPNGSNPTPWCTIDHSRTANIGLRLHKEIVDFYEFVRPFDYEETARRDLIERVQRVIGSAPKRVHGSAQVDIKSFGSFAAGLYLPTADMDLVALSTDYIQRGEKTCCQTKSKIRNMARYLEGAGLCAENTMQPVLFAKVPIIKFTDKRTGIKVDISFENDSGLKANQTFLEWKRQYPAMPYIVVLIKQMLAMRDLNEVVSGGLGGFSIICLVVSMMQMMPDLQSGSLDSQEDLGELLLNFLDLYGNKFDIKRTGITLNPPGYYDKINKPKQRQNSNNLTIIDPNNRDNDISGGSRNIAAVLDLFRTAHSAIQRRLGQIRSGQKVDESILGCVWAGNYSSFIHQRNKLSLIHRGHPVSPPPGPVLEPEPEPRFPRGKKRRPAPQPVPREQLPEPSRQRPPPSRPQIRPQGPPKHQAQQGRMSHPLPQRPVDYVGNGPLPNPKGVPKSYGLLRKEATMEKRRIDRAKKIKKTYPGIRNVPNQLTIKEYKEFAQTHGSTS